MFQIRTQHGCKIIVFSNIDMTENCCGVFGAQFWSHFVPNSNAVYRLCSCSSDNHRMGVFNIWGDGTPHSESYCDFPYQNKFHNSSRDMKLRIPRLPASSIPNHFLFPFQPRKSHAFSVWGQGRFGEPDRELHCLATGNGQVLEKWWNNGFGTC